AISLGGGVTVNATSGSSLVDSLDLTDPTTAQYLHDLQLAHRAGGTLFLTGGIASGGNIVLSPYNLASTITGNNVPANVTLTLQGFQGSTPLNVSITASSTTDHVQVSGIEQFISSPVSAAGILQVTSTQPGPLVVVDSTGTLSSNGSLTVKT